MCVVVLLSYMLWCCLLSVCSFWSSFHLVGVFHITCRYVCTHAQYHMHACMQAGRHAGMQAGYIHTYIHICIHTHMFTHRVYSIVGLETQRREG